MKVTTNLRYLHSQLCEAKLLMESELGSEVKDYQSYRLLVDCIFYLHVGLELDVEEYNRFQRKRPYVDEEE